jgi:hypothetical protein
LDHDITIGIPESGARRRWRLLIDQTFDKVNVGDGLVDCFAVQRVMVGFPEHVAEVV